MPQNMMQHDTPQQAASQPLKPATSYTRIDADGQPYLEGSRCPACAAVFLGSREHCGRCGVRAHMQSIRLSERGRLYNYTIVYRSYPGIKVPFISAIVDLDAAGGPLSIFESGIPGHFISICRYAWCFGAQSSRPPTVRATSPISLFPTESRDE